MPGDTTPSRDASGDVPESGAPPDGQRIEMTGGAAAGSAGAVDRAAVRAWAGELTRTAAARWLTPGTVAAIGKGMAVSITRYHRVHGGYPTWAQALTGIDPALLTPLRTPPLTWPLPAAAWRRQLRHRLMVHLKYTRWITYNRISERVLEGGDRNTFERGHQGACSPTLVNGWGPPWYQPGQSEKPQEGGCARGI